MVFLFLQEGLGDEHGQIHVFVAGFFELRIHEALDVFPDGIAIGAVDEHALDAGVVDELGLGAHVGVPFGEVHLHIRDLLHLLLVCHSLSQSFTNQIHRLLYEETGEKSSMGADLPPPGIKRPPADPYILHQKPQTVPVRGCGRCVSGSGSGTRACGRSYWKVCGRRGRNRPSWRRGPIRRTFQGSWTCW